MACVKKWRGQWAADFRDGFRKRHVYVFDTKAEAEDCLAQATLAKKSATKPTVDPDIRLVDYAARFLRSCEARGIKPKTILRYEGALRRHILPHLGREMVREINRPAVKELLTRKLADRNSSVQGQRRDFVGRGELARGTVRHLLGTVNAVLSEAVEDQLIASNPLSKLGKKLGLGLRGKKDKGKIKALDAGQLGRFLGSALVKTPDLFPAFAVMAWAGVRLGEALALRWEAVDLAGGKITVDRQLDGTTKTGGTREVDMADQLREVLAGLLTRRREEAFRRGESVSPFALFPEFTEEPDNRAEARVVKRVRAAMTRCLKAAGLPLHFTPHSLRHSFGSQLIAAGISPAYVQQQIGHASIQMTVDVYGSWLPAKVEDAVNRLAAQSSPWSGDRMATEGVSDPLEASPGVGSDGAQVLAATGTEGKTASPLPSRPPRSPCTCT